MDFGSKVVTTFQIFGHEARLTETIIDTYVVMSILIIFAIVARIKLNKFTEVPSTRFQNFVEALVEAIDNFVASNLGSKYRYFGNWFFGIFLLILCSNLIGLLGFRAPTADLATTASFGLTSFFIIHFMGITKLKGHYFKEYLKPMPLFLPMNIVGELALPLSLSFRLFGNILGGTIIMGLFYSLPYYCKIVLPAALNVYFDVFAGSLQSFIFVMLSMAFLKEKLPE